MRKIIYTILGFVMAGLFLSASYSNAQFSIFRPEEGGTGTSTRPTPDQILIGGDNSTRYDIKRLTAGTNITIATSSGAVTVSSSGSGLTGSGTQGQATYWTGSGSLGSVATGTISSSGGITTTSGRSVFGGALSIVCDIASSIIPGCLSSADWTTFNNKQASLGSGTAGQILAFLSGIPTWTSTTTFSGGLTYNSGNVTNTLTAGDGLTRTIDDVDCDTASGSVFGCLASADWTIFNNKESTLTFSAPLSRSVNTISIPKATRSIDGYLASTDFTTFDNKISSTSLSATSPVTYSSVTGVIACPTCNTSSLSGSGASPLLAQWTSSSNLTSVATSSLGLLTTDVAEGSNLYFTNARARSALSATTPISYNSVTGDFSLGTVGLANGGTATTTFSNGGVVFSDGVKLTQDTTNFFWDDANNRLGIATTAPKTSLHVAGGTDANNGQLRVESTGNIPGVTFYSAATDSGARNWGLFANSGTFGHLVLQVGTAQGTAPSATKLVIDSSGKVGIGSTTPYAVLDVAGNAVIADNLSTSYVTGTSTATSSFTGGIKTDLLNVISSTASSSFANGVNLTDGCFAINGTCVGGSLTGSGAANRATFWTTASNLSYDDTFVWDNTNKRLGVGTTSPWAQLSVEMDTSNPAFVVSNNGSSSPAFYVGGVNQDGMVGIGTVSPTGGLHNYTTVAGANNGVIRTETTQTTTNTGYWLKGGGTNADWLMLTNRPDLTANADDWFLYKNLGTVGVKMVVTDAGYVGIGTTSPRTKLHIAESGSNLPRLRLDAGTGASGIFGLDFYEGTDSPNTGFRGGIYADSSNNDVSIFTGSDGSNPRMTIADAGVSTTTFVGPIVSSLVGATSTIRGSLAVGTSTLGSSWRLTVDGGLCLSRNTLCPATQVPGGIAIDTNGATTLGGTVFDVAEIYSSRLLTSPGDIVAVDTDSSKIDAVKKAVSGDILIGIVSTSPAIYIDDYFVKMGLGEPFATSTKPAVALAGRVPVKVSDENGAIKKGDFISASSVSGVGMKATTSSQTVGIALESFSGKLGKITVFVNLK